MKRIFYVSILLLCFNILCSLNIGHLNSNDKKQKLNKVYYRRRHETSKNATKNTVYRRAIESSESKSLSSSFEKTKWKDEWRELWLQKKLEALNSSLPDGDKVNMVAARPWGVSCGDPKQHDMPWGSCLLPMECEDEYRIYRGDYFCGRTQFVCCALQLTNYDLYGGFDASFAATSFESDSKEKKGESLAAKEKRKKKRRQRKRKQRRKERAKRKKRIRKVIKRIVKAIHKVLKRISKNGTLVRKRKTKELKKFVQHLKKKYKHDRRLVKDIHDQELIKVDQVLQKRLTEIHGMNEKFWNNAKFRDIVVNGTVNKGKLRSLLAHYPELEDTVDLRRSARPDYLEYDIEYGYIYD